MKINIDKISDKKISNIEVLKSGWAGELYSIKFEGDNQKYILKSYGSSEKEISDLKHEWAGINLLDNLKYPVPKPFKSDFDSEIPCILIEQIDGEDFWSIYNKSTQESKVELLNKFTKAFLELHQIKISNFNSKYLNKTTNSFIEKEINSIKKIAEENNFEFAFKVINWLNAKKEDIVQENLSILHRDYHPWNVIVDKNEDVHIIDWVWGIGDYRFDLAWTCTLMERSNFKDFSEQLYKIYQELHMKKIDNFDYFKVLATLRWLMNVEESLKTGENLNEARKLESEAFFKPLIENAIKMIVDII